MREKIPPFLGDLRLERFECPFTRPRASGGGAVEDRAAVIPPSIVETDEEPPTGFVHPVRRMDLPRVGETDTGTGRTEHGRFRRGGEDGHYEIRSKFDTCAVTSEPSGVIAKSCAVNGTTVESVPVVVSGS
jgi:hypothetical protein